MTVTSITELTSEHANISDESASFDEDGFFTQSDWEFELDTMSDRSLAALQAHLDKAPSGVSPSTVGYLRKLLLETQGVTVTPFND